MTTEYDKFFQLWGSTYFSGIATWPWFKAQAIAESNLDRLAISPVGATGVMQIMPGTAGDLARELMMPNYDIFDPMTNIHFGVRYMWKMWSIFKKEEGLERLRFAFGAYNAGAGHIIEAQGLTDRPMVWDAVSRKLILVTGPKNSTQTIEYVKRIERIRLSMIDV